MRHPFDWRHAVLVAALFGASAPTDVAAQRFIEVSRQIQDIDSDFDDSILLTAPSLTVNIPALDRAEGLAFAYGRWGDDAGFSFSYSRTDVTTTSVLGDSDAAHRSYGLDFGFAPWLSPTGIGLSPLFEFGFAYSTLNLHDQAVGGSGLGDAGFGSIAFHAGIGAMLRLGGFGHVTADYSRRYLKFHDVKAFGDSTELAEGLSATGDFMSIALAIYIPE